MPVLASLIIGAHTSYVELDEDQVDLLTSTLDWLSDLNPRELTQALEAMAVLRDEL